MDKWNWGVTKREEEAALYRIKNKNQTEVIVSDYGATMISYLFHDKNGTARDVILGYDDLQSYEESACYFGATVGRNCNRIEGSRMVIAGEEVRIQPNEGENNLHSGENGFSKLVWQVAEHSADKIIFSHYSPEKEQGFPGNVEAKVTYHLTEDDCLEIIYDGIADRDTVMNWTNHSYFNLAGQDSGQTVMNHMLQIYADAYTPVKDSKSIPTGELAPVEGTPFDFRQAKRLGQDAKINHSQLEYTGGYDHNFVLSDETDVLKKMAYAYCEETGIELHAYTTCCGVQLYAGNFIGEQIGKKGAQYHDHSGFCLEAQYYPNAVNQENFPSPVVKANEPYYSVTQYRLAVKE